MKTTMSERKRVRGNSRSFPNHKMERISASTSAKKYGTWDRVLRGAAVRDFAAKHAYDLRDSECSGRAVLK